MTAALNPRFVAYCRAVGIPATVKALRARDETWAEFFAWIAARVREWRTARGVNHVPTSDKENADFTAFCEAAAAEGEAARG